MSLQRDLFFGKTKGKSSKKDAFSGPGSSRRFRPIDTGKIEVRFDNQTVTQFGGYPAWDSFARSVGLKEEISRAVRMKRGKGSFTPGELGRFLVEAKVLGAKRISHVDTIRSDPLLCKAHGLEVLPSGVTLNRFLKEHTEREVCALDRLCVRLTNSLYKKYTKSLPKEKRKQSKRIVLDYDSTTFTIYGKQEGADRGYCFRKKDKPGFQPRFAFIGDVGITVNHELRPQSQNLDKDFLSFHEETLKRLPKGVKVRAVRGDSALYSKRIIRYLERKGLLYAISASMTERLIREVEKVPEDAWIEGIDEKGRPYSITRIKYQPKGWEKARTFIITRRLKKETPGQLYLFPSMAYKYHAYVTNFPGPLFRQYKFAVQRATLESNIKEYKSDLGYAFLPCAQFVANQAYLIYVILARNLSIFFKVLTAPAGPNRWTLGTFRHRVLCICGNLIREGGKLILSLPVWWPYRTIVKKIMERAFALAPL